MMPRSAASVRLMLALPFCVIVFALLSYLNWGNTFCDGGNTTDILLLVLKFTVAIGAVDFVAGLCGLTIARFVNSDRDGYLISALIAAIIVGIPMFSLATLLYKG
jgi:hypothetical protein